MGFGWLKKAFGIGKAVVQVGAKIDPKHFDPIEMFIEGVEMALPDMPGADKKAKVEAFGDVSLEVLVAQGRITQAQADKAKDLRSAAIDAYVSLRNAEAKAQATRDAYEDLIDSFKS